MRITLWITVCSIGSLFFAAAAGGPQQATGIKIGEVTDTSAIIWTRLTRHAKCNPPDAPMVTIKYEKSKKTKKGKRSRGSKCVGVSYPAGLTVADIRGAAPGAAGEVRVGYCSGNEWTWSSWQAVAPESDFTKQFKLSGLLPSTRYRVTVEGRATGSSTPSSTISGSFLTAPAATNATRVVFTVITGQAYNSRDEPGGYKSYGSMLKLHPSFFVHTGDIVYYDKLGKTPALARWHWQRCYGLPSNVEFHRHVGSYFMKDDHETLMNDSYPGMKTDYMWKMTFEKGQEIFLEQVPMASKCCYRTVRWGKDLQIWLVEGRDYRSSNKMPDGPNKTIWGKEQKAWFKKTVEKSNATFRVLMSPTPIVGPDRESGKSDNHSNKAFAYEGNEIRQFIATQKNMVVVCGDRHWQYHSVDPKTQVHEFSCGPVSDKHAGGYKMSLRKPMHKYLNIKGGFLSGTVERKENKPTLTFRYHNPDGQVYYEYQIKGD